MGGADGRFRTTHWTEILDARTLDDERHREAVGLLLERYWKPVYCYLRRRGYGNEDAKDLTQGFFQEVVLGRDLIGRADRTKGRFRTFLLASLDHYAASVHRAEVRQKRSPEGAVFSFDTTRDDVFPEPADSASPEEAFHHAWAAAVLDHALADARESLEAGGRGSHWQAFKARILEPIYADAPAPSLDDLCRSLGIEDEEKASNMIITAKRAFQAALRRQVRQFVGSDADVEQEIRDLIGILATGGAGPP